MKEKFLYFQFSNLLLLQNGVLCTYAHNLKVLEGMDARIPSRWKMVKDSGRKWFNNEEEKKLSILSVKLS